LLIVLKKGFTSSAEIRSTCKTRQSDDGAKGIDVLSRHVELGAQHAHVRMTRGTCQLGSDPL
jgi:hypothetical protein